MIGRGTAIGLSVLCALLFSAIAVQSASAAKAVNTTAVTCFKSAGTLDFEDAHCDKKVGHENGPYGHAAIPLNTATEIESTNELTGGATDPGVLLGKAFGAATEITCNKVNGDAELHNVETSGKHTVTGTSEVQYTECSVQKPSKCDVEEPIEFSANAEGFEESGNMGINFTPASGSTFVELTYINNGAEKCALNGQTISVTGSVVATASGAAANAEHTGATADYDHTKITGRKTLQVGGVAAGLEVTTTVRAKDGTPLSATTTT